MENILPRREARENAFLLAFSQTFGDVPLQEALDTNNECGDCLLYTSPSPRDTERSRMPSSA